MSRDGWLPSGVTNADIDRAAQGEEPRLWHCPACHAVNTEEEVRCSLCHHPLDDDAIWEEDI
jgi:hypothetical protein